MFSKLIFESREHHEQSSQKKNCDEKNVVITLGLCCTLLTLVKQMFTDTFAMPFIVPLPFVTAKRKKICASNGALCARKREKSLTAVEINYI